MSDRDELIGKIARKIAPWGFYDPETYRRWANRSVGSYEMDHREEVARREAEEVLAVFERYGSLHDHERCCAEHGSHVIPHRDCFVQALPEGWACGKCARVNVIGFDDGQISQHHRTCPLREPTEGDDDA